ncbi:MAG: hypothetical protein AB7N76_31110 [Planctomycetota bacterium]
MRRARLSPDRAGPTCRWLGDRGALVIDVVPHGAFGSPGMPTRFYEQAVAAAQSVELDGETIRVFSAPFLFATKIEAFADRVAADPYASEDLEDLVQLLEHSRGLVDAIDGCPDVRLHVSEWARRFAAQPRAAELVEGHGGRPRARDALARLGSLAQ